MTLESMTGFGRADGVVGDADVVAELKSLNGKQLKLTIRCPSWLSYLEPTLEAAIKKFFRRGSIYLHLNFEKNENSSIQVNHERLEALIRAFSARGLNEQPLCLVPGVIEENQRPSLSESDEATLQGIVADAIKDLKTAREREGEAVTAVLMTIIDSLDHQRASIAQHYVDHRKEAESRLKARLNELAEGDGNLASLDPLLFSREIALHLDRVDIREELDRLSLHLAEAKTIIEGGTGARGRKLEFTAQEIGREINTTGSKSQYYPISRAVIEMKTLLDQFKEQVANIE